MLKPMSPAKNYDNKIVFLGLFAAGETCAASPVFVKYLQLLSDLLLMAPKNKIFRQRNITGNMHRSVVICNI